MAKPQVSVEEMMYASIRKKVTELEAKSRIDGAGGIIDNRLSTGLYSVDLIYGGGIMPGRWYTNFGPEQSAKSTLTQQTMLANIKQVPFLRYKDAEGSSGGTDYLENQMLTNGIRLKMEDLFGIVDNKGKVVKQGLVSYDSDNIIEDFFRGEAAFLRRLPDKLYVNNKWWLVFPDDKKGREIVGGKFDKDLKRKYDRLFVPATDGRPQGLIIFDSYPAMIPSDVDDDEWNKNGMAILARKYSELIPLIKGKLAKKKVTLLGVNQLRLRPGFTMGSPEYEPGGEALKFFSDVRTRMSAVSSPWAKKAYDEEESLEGGTDRYRWIKMRTHKNKGGPPNVECWQRIWVEDDQMRGRGFDPVADTFEYLKMTNQLGGTRNKLYVKMDKIANKKAMNWLAFKTLVLGNVEQVTKVERDYGFIGKTDKAFKLRTRISEQMKSGKGLELYFAARKAGPSNEE